MCVPSSDADTFIGYDLIDGCRVRGTGTTGPAKSERNAPWVKVWRSADPIGNGDLYLGMDVGRKKDLAVFWLAEDVAGILVAREVKAMHKQRFAVQEDALDEYVRMPNFRRGCIDATGMGMQLAERAHERHGYRIEAVTFSGSVKEQMASAVRAGMEDSNFRIPDEQFVVADFRKIKKVVTASGNIRYEGDRDEDGHSDRFWSGALCREAKGSGPAGTTEWESAAAPGRVARGRSAVV
jgi:phage FluMu gp28-like protein